MHKIPDARMETWQMPHYHVHVCEPGFTAERVKYSPLRELLYVRKSKVKFAVPGQKFIADDECVADVPRFTPRSIEVQEHSEICDLGGRSCRSVFLQCVQSIRVNGPERYNEENTERLKKRFGIHVKSIGMK